MGYNFIIFVILIAVSCCLAFIAFLAWRKREIPVAFYFFFSLCASIFYAFGYAFEVISTSLEGIKFWLRIEYIGISFGTLIWFFTIVLYTNIQVFKRKWIIIGMMIVPVVTFISHYTNDWHHLFYRKMVIDETSGFPVLIKTAGPFYMLHIIYNYVLVIIGMGLLIHMYRKAEAHMKMQVALLIIGSCGPFGITLIYLSGMLNTPIDFSPIGFLFLGIFFIWGIYQFNMMKLVPHALQKVFESMREAVIVVDRAHLITSYNQSAVEIFKELGSKKVVGQPAFEIFAAYPKLVKMLVQGESIKSKLQLEKDLGLRYYQVYSSDIHDKRQNPVGKMLLLNDITEEMIAEEKLRHHSRQLRELNAFKDKMFTIVAHDIRDPLSILISLMEILKEEIQQDDENHLEVVYEMDKQIQNTFTLVENLLDWFRSQKGGMIFHPDLWNLSSAMKRNVEFLQPKIERKRIKIFSQIEKDTSVYADKEMLELTIRNILTNAIKFTEYDGSIFINAEKIDGKVIVSIQDTGKGIHPEQAKALLQERESYPISSTGTAGERGIGIGLMLCKEFVQINGGELWFESTPNEGSTFYFSVPTHDYIRNDSYS
ncbi:histidine kinase N-terminal 7TM domain-containing protein [Niallia sp.]|uniref:sensor histidine kinase n=1 Tax=Niallia sp. TaxID=2837523 RepID=UPI002897A975|nr:histidine kinase N-terminal 7TM domain-containing protein [Niallia sp.]